MRIETFVISEERNVSLIAYIHKADEKYLKKRPAMLVIPGGGYETFVELEAEPVALAYMNAGYNAFVLRYTTVEKGKWPYPLQDYEDSMELIGARADEFGIDVTKIACVGFSAGGHLAACAATIAKHKPKAAILAYPVILDNYCDMCQTGMPYPYKEVNEDTAPCFIVTVRDDMIIPVKNSLAFASALEDWNIQFEMHIYSLGQHGFSTAAASISIVETCNRLPEWIDYSVNWLDEIMGKLTVSGYTEPKLMATMNGDALPMLSILCTINHIRNCRNADDIMSSYYEMISSFAKESNGIAEELFEKIGDQTIKNILEILAVPAEQIAKLDENLKRITNILGEEKTKR